MESQSHVFDNKIPAHRVYMLNIMFHFYSYGRLSIYTAVELGKIYPLVLPCKNNAVSQA